MLLKKQSSSCRAKEELRTSAEVGLFANLMAASAKVCCPQSRLLCSCAYESEALMAQEQTSELWLDHSMQ